MEIGLDFGPLTFSPSRYLWPCTQVMSLHGPYEERLNWYFSVPYQSGLNGEQKMAHCRKSRWHGQFMSRLGVCITFLIVVTKCLTKKKQQQLTEGSVFFFFFFLAHSLRVQHHGWEVLVAGAWGSQLQGIHSQKAKAGKCGYSAFLFYLVHNLSPWNFSVGLPTSVN